MTYILTNADTMTTDCACNGPEDHHKVGCDRMWECEIVVFLRQREGDFRLPIEQEQDECAFRHLSFIRAEALSEPLRSHFPKSAEEANAFVPLQRFHALSSKVLVVAQTRVVCQWAAYCDAVAGWNHQYEWQAVLDYGAKLDEAVARVLFPEFKEVVYAG